MPLPAFEIEVVSLSASLKKARIKAVSTKAEFDVLRAAAKLGTENHNVASAVVREE